MRWVPAPLHCLIEGWVRAEGCSVVLPYVLEPCCHMATRAAGRIKPLNSPFDSCQSRGIVTCYSYASEITNHCHISMYKRDPSNSLAPVLSLKNLETNICPCTYLSRHLNIFVSSLIAAEDIISGIVYICFKCFCQFGCWVWFWSKPYEFCRFDSFNVWEIPPCNLIGPARPHFQITSIWLSVK